MRRVLPWLAGASVVLLILPLLVVLAVAVFGWNWARAPLESWALRQTGRTLHLGGDLLVAPAWPRPRISIRSVSFANPAWAAAPQMVVADRVDVSIDLLALLRGQLVFPDVQLWRPQVFLEQADGGRKNWLLDTAQTDEQVRIPVDRLVIHEGQIQYQHAARQTAILAELSTAPAAAPGVLATNIADGLRFRARGRFLGQPLVAEGQGGAVLAWRDESQPYPLQVQATVGPTQVTAVGTVTGLREWRALDLEVTLSGDSLSSLYTMTGVALPPTPAYRSAGRLVRVGAAWRYGPFTGQVGKSDLAGTLQVQTDTARPLLSGSLRSRQLDLADLGPAVGKGTTPSTRVLPDLPLDTTRWAGMDADVRLQVQSLLRDSARWVDTLQVRLLLQDRVLRLDPLSFGIAGGDLLAQVSFDARNEPLRGHASARLSGLKLARLLPAAELQKDLVGRLDGDLDLRGRGASIGRMLAIADGHLRLSAGKGQVSRLLMEQSGLHLLEILRLNLLGDQTVAVNCARLDFQVAQGVMQARTLMMDTAVNTLLGSGQVNLAQETLDLTVVPRTKVVSLVSLRTPIHITGGFGNPDVAVDRGRLLARGAGALALGLINPILALVPLVDPGPGVQAGCGG
jgi:AsmA protein